MKKLSHLPVMMLVAALAVSQPANTVFASSETTSVIEYKQGPVGYFSKITEGIKDFFSDEDEKEEAAAEAVKALLNSDQSALAKGATRDNYNAAKEQIEALENEEIKAELTETLEKADELLDKKELKEAKKAIKSCWDSENGKMRDGVTRKMVKSLKKKVNKLPKGKTKTKYKKIVKACEETLDNLELAEVQNAIVALWDGPNGTLAAGATQETYDAAKAKVDSLKDSDQKTEYKKILKAAKEKLNERVQNLKDAQEVILKLWDGPGGTLATGATWDIYEAAQTKVDKLQKGDQKNEYQKILDAAKIKLNEKDEAKKQVKKESGSSGSTASQQMVYWVPNGKVYHYIPDCRYIKGNDIHETTIDEAVRNGKTRMCAVCGRYR